MTVANSQPFSLLITIYAGERPDPWDECLRSVHAQSLLPSEIVVVEDGPVRDDVQSVTAKWEQSLPIKVFSLDVNQGAGPASAYGITQCQHELVARLDSDDICTEGRFARQMAVMTEHPEIDALGGAVVEFWDSLAHLGKIIRYPTSIDDVARFARFRSPLATSTVMMKRSVVLKAGNYPDRLRFEDYEMWVRMLMVGAKLANLAEPLCLFRLSRGTWGRRGGWDFFKREMQFQRVLRQEGFISRREWMRNVAVRAFPRLLPAALIRLGYQTFLREGQPTNLRVKGYAVEGMESPSAN